MGTITLDTTRAGAAENARVADGADSRAGHEPRRRRYPHL